MTPSEFIAAIGPAAKQVSHVSGVPYGVIIAQAALESSWGRSGLATRGKNLFGIKAGPAWQGQTITMPTREYLGGKWVTVQAAFRAYPDWLGSIRDHAAFLQNNRRYRPAFATRTPEDFARAIHKAGYATDPEYANKLIAIMRKHSLIAPAPPAPQVASSPSPAPEIPMAPFIAAALPALVSAAPELIKIFGSGSEVAERNAKAAETAVKIAQEALGATNAQEVAERAHASTEDAQLVRTAIQERWYELVEAGGGGIAGARQFDLQVAREGIEPRKLPAMWVTWMLVPLPYIVVIAVVFGVGGEWSPEIRASVVTAVVSGVLFAIIQYWIGSSWGSSRKTDALFQQPERSK